MSKERYDEIINEAYSNYVKTIESNKDLYLKRDGYYRTILTKDEFMRESRLNSIFTEKWGLEIKKRDLTLLERKKIYETNYTNDMEINNDDWLESKLKTRDISTILITLTYKNEKIEIYE